MAACWDALPLELRAHIWRARHELMLCALMYWRKQAEAVVEQRLRECQDPTQAASLRMAREVIFQPVWPRVWGTSRAERRIILFTLRYVTAQRRYLLGEAVRVALHGSRLERAFARYFRRDPISRQSGKSNRFAANVVLFQKVASPWTLAARS